MDWIQLISALATAAAAIFAALSAKSAAHSAREMERARELSSAPVLTITPRARDIQYYFDVSNGRTTLNPYREQLVLENHGNGPELTVVASNC